MCLLAAIGIIYGGMAAMVQDDVKKLVAYSSVSHLGFIVLGIFSFSREAMSGAVLQMVNHGISTGALFLLVGVIYDRRHTRLIEDFGGVAKVMPVFTTLFLIATFASVGVPGTNGFVGEFMVIMGTYASEGLRAFAGIHAVGAAFGVILAAVYMLSVVQRVFFGPLTKAENKHLTDISPRETLAVAPLIVFVFVIGFFPNLFLDRMKGAVAMLGTHYRDVSAQLISYTDESKAKLLPTDVFSPLFLKGAPALPGEAGAQPSEGVAMNDDSGAAAKLARVGGAR
jgi:NADH-quinone oxidoreductase subunit M